MPNGTERHAGVRVDVVELCVRKVEHGSGVKRYSVCDVNKESRELEPGSELRRSVTGGEQRGANERGGNGSDEHDYFGVKHREC